MTEEQLNENLIKSELQCICQDCIYLDKIVPIIRKMLSEEYKAGLEQSRFDKNMLERENQDLKKQLEEMDSKLFFTKNELEMRQKSIDNKLRQQKEFIEWLEDYIDTLKTESDSVEGLGICEYYTLLALEEVLSKYKEIIGGKHE